MDDRDAEGRSSSAGPIPDSSSNRGELTAPPLKINSVDAYVLRLPVDHHVQTGDPAVPHDDLATQSVGDDGQVLPRPDRLQVCGGSALAAAFFCVTSYQLTPSWTAPLKSAMKLTPSSCAARTNALLSGLCWTCSVTFTAPTLLW